jgi:predicted O-methyltransferase YrrM
LGFHFQANDYYSPLNDCQFLDANRDLWVDPYEPRDIEWNLNGQMDIAREVAVYVNELADIPYDPPSGQITYHWNNNFWNNADALVQYGLIRSRQPKRVIEIGCGWSSLLLARALKRNAVRCQVLQIEPYPNAAIFEQLPSDWVHLHCILQRASPEIFDRLEPGDLLFYDGSHCSKVASDVNWFFFRILPRLRSGVLIHLHDVFFPYDYPDEWIFKRGQTWNEQYVLQAFLMNNSKYRIVIANRYLFTHCKQELDKLYQGVQPSHGVSLWMKKL